ncbi:LuxR C-terminal-related transcriptional regulator [Planotetraspora sp. A-T 1434]|uniref:ATP-binding protein n=1 Tax=Planotetraspora sp. A-T 1434 TaxID=2979219 RepID=UPI0021BE9347|nr:LuxR C-terminal-related transcriptional regulator [Planotetraspora sp. A-T 1434]MCT9932326.1 LuxR C-terminal-related transcriptional regulator [Planotetraspora sp. A-T 1434]
MGGTAFTRQVGNLPADVTSFVGRRQELAEIKRLLTASRLVTLTGVGGVGKTRLALRAASEQHRAFDGVWLIDLAGLDDPSLVPQAVAATVGLCDQAVTNPVEALSEFLSTRRTLLVLDNCEHLLDVCAALASRLLRAAPELRILATSRQSLGISGERAMNVTPLSVPDSGRPPPTPKELERYDAITLFADRAAAVLPGFVVDDRNQEAVATLCRRLDGIPLAIELAAVRLRSLSINALVERLGDPYRWLTCGSRTAVPRQRTLHALVDWSFQLMPTPEQMLWTRMSIFPGHFDLDAVEGVCVGDGIEPEDVLDLLDAVVDKSLLQREEHGGEVRYRMLETLREFGQMRLTGPDERRALLRRHRDWYRRLAEQAAAEWFGPGQASWFARLKLDQVNFRAAMEFCLREPGEAETGLRMATDLHRPHWLPNAFFLEGRHWLDRMLAAAPEPTATRAEALCVDAWLAFMQGDTEAGHPLIEEGTALADKLGDPVSMAQASSVSGKAAYYSGDLARATGLLDEAVARHTANGDCFGVVTAALTLAAALGSGGDAARATALFEECLSLAADHGESWCRAWVLTVFALHMWQLGETPRATSLARESLLLGHAFEDRLNVASNIEALAWIMASEGRHERAACLLGAADAVGGTVGISALLLKRQVEFHEKCVASLREAMGDKAFNRARRHGTRLTVEQAVAEALGDRPDKRAQPEKPAAEPPPSPLTAREREIAELIAQGLSNKEIAAALVVAQRTAEGHVEHILAKLGFTSRAQIAAWMTTQKASQEAE